MTINTNHSAAYVPVDIRAVLWDRWVALRNGALSLADEIVAPDCAVHLPAAGAGHPPADGAAPPGRQALISWLSAVQARYPDWRLTVQVGPIIGVDMVAARWAFSNVDPGGAGGVLTSAEPRLRPHSPDSGTADPTGSGGPGTSGGLDASADLDASGGPSASGGPRISFHGTDIIKIESGRITEYWGNHDGPGPDLRVSSAI